MHTRIIAQTGQWTHPEASGGGIMTTLCRIAAMAEQETGRRRSRPLCTTSAVRTHWTASSSNRLFGLGWRAMPFNYVEFYRVTFVAMSQQILVGTRTFQNGLP